MNNLLPVAVITVGLAWAPLSLGQSTLPEWLMGQWQPSRSHYGSDPIDYCLLTIGPGQLSWHQHPSDEGRTVSYEVVVEEDDFAIAKAEYPRKPSHDCLGTPQSPAYFRFDRKNFFHCTFEARQKKESAAATCPKPFGPIKFDFELSVWDSLEEALQIADNPSSWSGYFRLPNYR